MRKYRAGRNNFNLNNNPSCHTRSNACAISRNTPGQCSFFSNDVDILSVILCIWGIVECWNS